MKTLLAPVVFVLTIFSATPTTHHPFGNYNVAWNVGQGQWITAIRDDYCWHFDAGGEFAPSQKILNWCQHRKNKLLLSHWDLDHLSFVPKAFFRKLKACLFLRPRGKASRRKQQWVSSLPSCSDKANTSLKSWSPSEFKTSNDSSHVLLWENILIPGDSSAKMEKTWHLFLPLKDTSFLILGHHGSRTSTSENLLRALPMVHTAISSARFKKHRHPHPQVEVRLRLRGIALLKTEDWGNIWWSADIP